MNRLMSDFPAEDVPDDAKTITAVKANPGVFMHLINDMASRY